MSVCRESRVDFAPTLPNSNHPLSPLPAGEGDCHLRPFGYPSEEYSLQRAAEGPLA